MVDQTRASVKSAAAGYRGRIRAALSDGIPRSRLAAQLGQCREEELEVEIYLSEVTFAEQVRGSTMTCSISFEALYQIQAMTNPRLQNELGRLQLIPRDQIPFGIPGSSYATAPFTHVNSAGARFSNGSFGVLYLADRMDTAVAEVRHILAVVSPHLCT